MFISFSVGGSHISPLLFCEECVLGTYKSSFARTYLLAPGSKSVSRGVSCYWGLKNGEHRLSLRLGLRLSLRDSASVSLFAARSSAFCEWGAPSPSSHLDLWPLASRLGLWSLASRLGLRSFASRLGLRPLALCFAVHEFERAMFDLDSAAAEDIATNKKLLLDVAAGGAVA